MTEAEFLEVPREFLNAAVLIDDELYWGKPEQQVAEDVEEPGEFEGGGVTTKEPSKAHGSPINAEKVVDGFSDLGLICSTYRWRTDHSTFPNSTDKADLIILDWKLDNTETVGKTAVDFLNGRLQKDLAGKRRLRYVVIYTDKPMAGVLEKLASDLTIPKGISLVVNANSVDIGEENGPSLWRILYQSKSDTDEGELAKAILKDFSSFLGGLLPRMVMSGVAEIRSRTFEHLYRFNKTLDTVVTSQLLAKRSSELEFSAASDSFTEFVIGLIVNDFSDALYGSPMLNETSSIAAVSHHISKDAGAKLKLNAFETEVPKELLGALIEEQDYQKFFDTFKWLFSPNKKTESNFKEGKAPLEFANLNANQYAQLSVINLMNNYPKLWNNQVQLKSGTVVRLDLDGDAEARYLICVQPICDAVRLAVGDGCYSKFPFLELEVVEPPKRFTIVVEDAGNFVFLSTKHKLSEIFMASFAATPDTRDVRTDVEGPDQFFTDENGCRFHWISDLKEIYAMEIQNTLSTQGGRVGSNKFEWLRSNSSL